MEGSTVRIAETYDRTSLANPTGVVPMSWLEFQDGHGTPKCVHIRGSFPISQYVGVKWRFWIE
ncbi:MAG TPA: hypothetical protein VK424_01990 [Thermoplasmata archaeon]|nr:hypothetical protein [Thermoplasmata archaeon]